MPNTTALVNLIKRLKESGLAGDGFCVCVKNGENGRLITAACADLDNLSEKDIIEVAANGGEEHQKSAFLKACEEIFARRTDATVVISAAPEYLTRLSRQNAKIPPILDDFAQIIGPNLKTVEQSDIAGALKRRNACMLKDKGVIVAASTIGEAAAAILVAEKTAKTFVLAGFIGTPKPVRMWEAVLMNFVYKKKYGQIAKKTEGK